MSGNNFSLRFNGGTMYLQNGFLLPDGHYNDFVSISFEATLPTGHKITLNNDTVPLDSVEFSPSFVKSAPFEGVPIKLDILNALVGEGEDVVTLNNVRTALPMDAFPDGTYLATLSLDIGSRGTYTDSIKIFNIANLDQSISAKIDPTAGYYTQYKNSKEERQALDALVKILTLREGLILDFTNGYDSSALVKLSVLNKLVRNCPVFRCSCAI